MSFIELLKMSMRTVVSNPLRTLLTMLGVIIGVTSVVTLVSIGQGASAEVEKQMDGLGTNLLVVEVRDVGRATQLNVEELMRFEGFPEMQYIAPTVVRNTNVKYDRKQEQVTVIGTNDRYPHITKSELATGRFISQADSDFRNNVAVLGNEVARAFFGFLDPVGETINIEGKVFTVIGTLKHKGQNISGTSVDRSVIIPLETARRTMQMGNVRTTFIETPTTADVYIAEQTMQQYLTYSFRSESGFTLRNQDELLKSRMEVASQLSYLLAGIACISLLVGGIGIMNIMLVTVSERTREIGIRKSIGAKRRSILMQFLVEATVISGLGGLIGLLLGIALSHGLAAYIAQISTRISWEISIGAFLFSVMVGIIFGLYPANKASKLNPIDALRFD